MTVPASHAQAAHGGEPEDALVAADVGAGGSPTQCYTMNNRDNPPPAARATTEQLPEPVAAAVFCRPDHDVDPLAGVARVTRRPQKLDLVGSGLWGEAVTSGDG
jgi:hypothetical protein